MVYNSYFHGWYGNLPSGNNNNKNNIPVEFTRVSVDKGLLHTVPNNQPPPSLFFSAVSKVQYEIEYDLWSVRYSIIQNQPDFKQSDATPNISRAYTFLHGLKKRS